MFGASWCAPCRALKPVYKKVSEGYLSEDLGVVFSYVDVDEDPELAAAAQIRSVPTIFFVGDDLNPVVIKSRVPSKMEQEIEHLLDI